jgi:beta-glucanase (GH16 family)
MVGMAPTAVAGSPVFGKAWKMVWGDEFAINGAPDPSKWSTGRWAGTTPGDEPWNHDPTADNCEGAYMASSQVAVVGNYATLTTADKPKTINGVVFPTASGMLQSAGHYAMKPGDFLESRIEIPRASGCWPAFWLLPMPVNTWPPEIDIFEFDTRSGRRPAFNYHTTSGVPPQRGPVSYGSSLVDYRVGFHTYGMHWADGTITAYLDGTPYVSLPIETTKPHYVIINLSTYAGPQPPAGTRMRVDWVRAWAL